VSAESRLGRLFGRVRSLVSKEPGQVKLPDEVKEDYPDWAQEAILKSLTEAKNGCQALIIQKHPWVD